jgi:EpsI family protein
VGTERQLKHLKIIFIILLAAVLLVNLVDYSQNRTVSGINLSRIPNTIEGWEAVEMPKSDDDQKRADAGDLLIRKYALKEHAIYLVAIQERGDRHRVHSPLNCYTGSGWNLLEKSEILHSRGFGVRRLLVNKGDAYRLVYYWFTNGSTHSTGFLEHLLLYAKDTLIGRSDAAWVYFDVSSDIHESVENTEALMSAFVTGLDYQRLFETVTEKNAPSQ